MKPASFFKSLAVTTFTAGILSTGPAALAQNINPPPPVQNVPVQTIPQKSTVPISTIPGQAPPPVQVIPAEPAPYKTSLTDTPAVGDPLGRNPVRPKDEAGPALTQKPYPEECSEDRCIRAKQRQLSPTSWQQDRASGLSKSTSGN